MKEQPKKINLLDFDCESLRHYFVEMGEKPFRASQIIKWVHQLGVIDFDQMTNLSKAFRAHLAETAEVRLPTILSHQTSRDGTQKWLLQLADSSCIETVFIPEEGRGTLCVSSQVGCPLRCSFCHTGTLGFTRNLTVGEIIAQLWIAVRALAPDGTTKTHAVTNVVMMGMGEPLLNFKNLVAAIDLMRDDFAFNLSKYRVTVSTAGVVPAMQRLRESSDVALAVSLHAPNNALRSQLVPLNKKYPLERLIPACREYFRNDPRRKVTFEYVMLEGVNDSPGHAKELVRLLHDVPAKINLIPLNPLSEGPYRCSPLTVIDRFRDILIRGGLNTVTRRTRGQDIDAACGQLVGDMIQF